VTADHFRMMRNSRNENRLAEVCMSRPLDCVRLGAWEHYAIPRVLALRGQLQCLLTDGSVRSDSLLPLCNRSLREQFHREWSLQQ
jgi:hypothetical protein